METARGIGGDVRADARVLEEDRKTECGETMNDEVMRVDARDILARSARFDLIFKYELARAWMGNDARQIREAEEAYLEMQRSRNGFYEREPHRRCPEDFMRSFRMVAQSIREKGYDPKAPPIPIDNAREILNGAHRLAICAAYGIDCYIQHAEGRAGGSVEASFRSRGIHPAVAEWGIRAYLRAFPEGRLAKGFGRLSDHPVLPFPNWREWAEEHRSLHVWMRLRRMRYCLLAKWRTGKGLQKAIKHAEELTCRMGSYDALADFWEGSAK